MASTKSFISRLLIPLLLLSLLLPCNGALATNVEDRLTIGLISTQTLAVEPLFPVERDLLSIYNMVYESLVTIDDDYQPQGCLAQSWNMSTNGKQWTFYLRPDVRFSDGTPLTAQDVVASAQRILELANNETAVDHGFYANLKYFITSITAEDDSTVVIKTKERACFGFLYGMTFPVVKASQVNQANPLGTGPYVFNYFSAGGSCSLSANPYWWKMQPQVKDLSVTFYPSNEKLIDAYEYAQVNAVFTRSIAAAQYKTGTASLNISFRTNQLECLLMNNSASELTKEVRMAIRYLVDPDKIISNVYSGLAVRADLPFYPGTWMYNDSLDQYFVRNKTEALRLLEEAGWEDSNDDGILDRLNSEGKLVNLHLRFYVYEEPGNSVRVEAANQIASMLAEAGIEAKVETMTVTDMQVKLKAGSFDLALVSFAMDPCPDVGFLMITSNTGNYSRYKNTKMDELCKDLRKLVNQSDYRNRLWEIQSLYAQDCPFLCLYWRMGAVLSRYMYTTARDVREYELLRGIESFVP